jgi:hypothetical protein
MTPNHQRLQHVASRTHDVSVGIALARVNCNARGLLIPLGILGPWRQQAAVEMNEAPSAKIFNTYIIHQRLS